MPLPPAMSLFPQSTALWKRIADGQTLLPEFSLASMMAYFVTRKVCDGQNADVSNVLMHLARRAVQHS